MLAEPFFQVGGTLSGDAACYIERAADRALMEILERGDYGLVLAPRQSGKSSLMAHALPRLEAAGWKAGFIDLQSLGGAIDPDIWFRDVIYRIVRSLKLPVDHAAWWAKRSPLGVTTRFAAFIEEEVLARLAGRVVLFFDEIDAALTTPFSDDFFITLRSLYTDRATNPTLRRLSLVLLGVAHPTDFIRGRRRTPFNIGTSIELRDFDRGSLSPFENVFGVGSSPLLERILYWTGGQPFLFQELAAAIYEGAAEPTPSGIDRLVDGRYFKVDLERNTHFRFINDFLLDGSIVQEALLARIRDIQSGEASPAFDETSPADQRLKLSGLVRIEAGAATIRNRIYARVFDAAWLARHRARRSGLPQLAADEPITGAPGEAGDRVSEVGNALPMGFRVGGYRIGRVLGAGGFGVTYAAQEEATGKTLAVKEYMPMGLVRRLPDESLRPLSASAEDDFRSFLERFRQEARLLATVSHPNVVGIQRYFEANGTGYIVMDMLDGKSLSAILEEGPIDENNLLDIALPLLDALVDLHGHGILHRDIKPSSVMLTKTRGPVLIDFGAARYALGSRSLSEITAVVSEGYAPMEQYAASGNQGPWTDIYALGGLLYRAATGIRPPAAPERLRLDPYQPASELLKGKFGAHVLAAIDAALAVHEEDRPQTAAQFRRMLTGEAAPAVRASVADKHAPMLPRYRAAPRPRRRSLWIGAAIAAALLIFGFGLLLAPYLGR